MVKDNVIYGGDYTSLYPLTPPLSDLHRFRLVSRCACGKRSSNEMTIVNRYRNMCRFNSGVSAQKFFTPRPGTEAFSSSIGTRLLRSTGTIGV